MEGDELVSVWWTMDGANRVEIPLFFVDSLCSLLSALSCGCGCWWLFLCFRCSLGGICLAFSFSVVHDCLVRIYISWEVMICAYGRGKGVAGIGVMILGSAIF